jgi:hypothetical protein
MMNSELEKMWKEALLDTCEGQKKTAMPSESPVSERNFKPETFWT